MPPETSLRGEPQWLIDMREKLADLDRRMATHEALVREELFRAGFVATEAEERLARWEGTD